MKFSLRGGFDDNPFMICFDDHLFEMDKEQGYCFKKREVISPNGFTSLDKVIQKCKSNTGYPIFLNMGDSSTSGWDSNRTFDFTKDHYSPFFNYKTYSDLLAGETIGANVINAGVPGYTSYQGKKYLEKILKIFGEKGVVPDYITIYFGNNDGTFNKYEDKVRIDFKQPSASATGERVTVQDFQKNLRDMVETSRDYGAKPIVIIPPIHYDWEPGIRADKHMKESLLVIKKLENTDLGKNLQISRGLYKQGKYKEACERDRYLPRLKQEYRKSLLKLAKKTGADIIDIQKQIPFTNNQKWFVDYCHPLEPANQIIMEKIKEIRTKDLYHKPLKEKLFRKRKQKIKQTSEISSNIYTIY